MQNKNRHLNFSINIEKKLTQQLNRLISKITQQLKQNFRHLFHCRFNGIVFFNCVFTTLCDFCALLQNADETKFAFPCQGDNKHLFKILYHSQFT